MKEREKTLKEIFNEELEEKNSDIETYRELIPKAKVIIEKYLKYFDSVSLYYNSISLTPKDENKLPPLFYCECIELGVLAKEIISHSYGWGGGGSCSIELVLNKC